MENEQIYVAGNLSLDIIMGSIEDWPNWGTEILTEDNETRIGGSVSNSAAIFISEKTNVKIISAIGDDFHGEIIMKGLENLNIDTSGIRKIKGETPFSVGIKHIDGERTFFSIEGIMGEINLEKDLKILRNARNSHILINGINLISCFRTEEMAEFIKKISTENTIYLDPGWPVNGWSEEYRDSVSKIVEFCDWFMPNEMELTGFMGESCVKNAMFKFGENYGANLATKLGKSGSAIFESGRIFMAESVESGSVKDTIGAGDSFNAAFITKKSRGFSSYESALYANEKAKLWIEGYYSELIKI